MMTVDMRKKPVETLDELFNLHFKFISTFNDFPQIYRKLVSKFDQSDIVFVRVSFTPKGKVPLEELPSVYEDQIKR